MATDGLDGAPLGCSEVALEGVLTFSVLVLRMPFGMGFSNPGPGETGVVPFEVEVKGWKLFIVIFGSSSMRKLDFRKLGAVDAAR